MSIEQKEPTVQTQTSATQRRYRTLAVVRQEAIHSRRKATRRLGFRVAPTCWCASFCRDHRYGNGYLALASD